MLDPKPYIIIYLTSFIPESFESINEDTNKENFRFRLTFILQRFTNLKNLSTDLQK